SMEPAVFIDYLAGGVRPLVVALHDHRPTDQDFAVISGSYFTVRNRQTRTADPIERKITGNNRRSFRQSVTLINRNAHAPEKLRQRFGKRRAAGGNDAQTAFLFIRVTD